MDIQLVSTSNAFFLLTQPRLHHTKKDGKSNFLNPYHVFERAWGRCCKYEISLCQAYQGTCIKADY